MLIMLSRKQTELTNAEKDYIKDVDAGGEKVSKYSRAITNLKNKVKYQEIQVRFYISLFYQYIDY